MNKQKKATNSWLESDLALQYFPNISNLSVTIVVAGRSIFMVRNRREDIHV